MEEEHDGVSKGFSSIPRSVLKIGDDEQLESVNSVHASNGIEKANAMSQVGKVSESFVKEGKCNNETELLVGQEEVKPSSCVVDLNNDVVCEKGPLVNRNDAKVRSGLDLNADAVSTCLNDELSSVSSSRRSEKSVSSECGSSNVSVEEEKDPMKLWKAMKQNGFFSKPHAGISSVSSSCLVSSSHGGIPAPRKRGRKTKTNNDAATVKKRKVEITRKEEVDRFGRLAAPSGLLNELNPAIINHVRNKKQVLSIIHNIVRDSENYSHHSSKHSSTTTVASRSDFNQGFKYAKPADNYSMDCYEEKHADGEFSEENNTDGAGSLTSEETSDLNCNSVLTVKAATVASQWLELLHQDIKGRVSALRRSKKRVRAVVTTELPFLITKEFSAAQENDPNAQLEGGSRDSTVDIHKTRWMALFNQLEQTLSEEEKQLENWLNQVRELQSNCDRGLQHLSLSSGQSFLQLGMPIDSRAANPLVTDKDLVVRAAAASMYSTCHFLASKENVTCT